MWRKCKPLHWKAFQWLRSSSCIATEKGRSIRLPESTEGMSTFWHCRHTKSVWQAIGLHFLWQLMPQFLQRSPLILTFPWQIVQGFLMGPWLSSTYPESRRENLIKDMWFLYLMCIIANALRRSFCKSPDREFVHQRNKFRTSKPKRVLGALFVSNCLCWQEVRYLMKSKRKDTNLSLRWFLTFSLDLSRRYLYLTSK